MDWMTLHRSSVHWRHLFDYYHLHDLRVVVSYLSSLIISLLLIGQQILSGQAQDALTEIIKSLPQFIPTP
jgi:hypothetical protein